MPPNARRDAPEHWRADAHGRELLKLDIPPDAARERRFEVSCSLQVRAREGAEATHGLTVLVDGAQQWARRVPTHPGGADSLDVRFSRTVPVGKPLRLVAQAQLRDAVALQLQIVAEEVS